MLKFNDEIIQKIFQNTKNLSLIYKVFMLYSIIVHRMYNSSEGYRPYIAAVEYVDACRTLQPFVVR